MWPANPSAQAAISRASRPERSQAGMIGRRSAARSPARVRRSGRWASGLSTSTGAASGSPSPALASWASAWFQSNRSGSGVSLGLVMAGASLLRVGRVGWLWSRGAPRTGGRGVSWPRSAALVQAFPGAAHRGGQHATRTGHVQGLADAKADADGQAKRPQPPQVDGGDEQVFHGVCLLFLGQRPPPSQRGQTGSAASGGGVQYDADAAGFGEAGRAGRGLAAPRRRRRAARRRRCVPPGAATAATGRNDLGGAPTPASRSPPSPAAGGTR